MRLLLVGLAFITAPAFAGSVRVVNLGPDFKVFLREIKTENTIESRRRAWDNFETKHQFLYDNVVFDKQNNPNWNERREKKLKLFFDTLPAIQDKMISIFDGADAIVQTHSEKFNQFFPDMPDGLSVYVLPSLMSFNGFVGHLTGEKYTPLFLGIDLIAQRNDNLDLLFSHEFFHVYHFSKKLKAWSNFASPLWFEGFATYVSSVLNPRASDSDVLMDSDLGTHCNNTTERAKWANDYLKVIAVDGDSELAEQIYSDWFKMDGAFPVKRRGYCLGLHVLRPLGTDHGLKEMALWSEDWFKSKVEQMLTEMAAQ